MLIGDRCYKGKKPVATGFLDFRSVEQRDAACRNELSLNRRLAPDVYLGIAHLTSPDDECSEPILVMRRLPGSLRLSHLATTRMLADKDLQRLVEQLCAFHAQAERGSSIDGCGTAASVLERWRANIAEIRGFHGQIPPEGVLAEIDRHAARYVSGRRRLFDRRIAAHRIIDGHGDLIADDIFCLPDGPRILDCLDFDDRLRFVDCIDDIAFLAMDLEFLGRPDLAQEVVGRYRDLAADTAPHSLVHHYTAYRALVRAKVDCIQHAQGVEHAGLSATRHTMLSLEHLRASAVRLALVGGLPGTGKSTLATRLAEAVGAVVVSSDSVRDELQRSGEIGGEPGAYRRGLYSPAAISAVYDAMLGRAEDHLSHGESVVLDASWSDRRERRRARELAAQTASMLLQLRCACPQAVSEQRIVARTVGFSDATAAIADRMSTDADPWTDAVTIDTMRTVDEAASETVRIWRSHHSDP
ncbi:bifunctional aminoglycoside phosphotransferase/ATP-binding protein [Rhodococcus sp. UNC363MFTsu5.1]|uniref:bifunctional aminoglycoside phosphotransferase/ATP-binding protein n=1 Tax=Rhodococcus sp. UNC363MFTsu5.1 TaxID=1449069 RepID=UPI001E486EB0|nr:bifunctional aminoglycoside phosphotransferase/ATP-binding protein [Rhodococcus sp. UNC363MFTsu5.1]